MIKTFPERMINMKKRLKVGFIGIEHDHGDPTLGSLRKLTDDFEVIAYAEPNEKLICSEHRKKLLEGIPQMSVEELLSIKSLDCVVVETHDTMLSKYGLMALEAGFPVHVDKPCGTDYASVSKMLETAKGKKLAFQSGYMYRFNPAVRKAYEMMKNGELGEIFSVEAHMDCEHRPEKREWLNTVPGGMMMFLGCHLVDLVMIFAGKPDKITCLSRSTHLEDIHSLDYGFAFFEYKNGLSFAKTCAREVDGFARRQLVITGSKATIEIKPLEIFVNGSLNSTKMSIVTHDDTNYSWNDCRHHYDFEPFDRYDGMMSEFAQIVRGEKENPFSIDYELELYKAVIAACGLELK